MPSLYEKRFLIFSGKGGAGKSTVAAAAALAAARRGKRVLIVEVGEQERLPAIFGRSQKSGYAGASVTAHRAGGGPPIWSMCVTAQEALREFTLRSVKFELFYDAIFENPVMRSFTAAAPGLNELTVLGKIEFLHQQAVGSAKSARFDLMIFDAPATGHALALFRVPLTAMGMTRLGPLYARVERIWRLLSDAERTAFNIVTLPEETSVSEALELRAASVALGLPQGAVVVNGVLADAFADDAEALRRARAEAARPDDLHARLARTALEAAYSTWARGRAQAAEIARLAADLKDPVVVLPSIDHPRIGLPGLETLADRLDRL